jgi:hypothetical protein
MLDPVESNRPTASDVHNTLLGKPLLTGKKSPIVPPPTSRVSIETDKDVAPMVSPSAPTSTLVKAKSGVETEEMIKVLTLTSKRTSLPLSIPPNTEVGSGMLSRLGENFSTYYSSNQFKITYEDAWFIEHDKRAKNKTLLNGVVIEKEKLSPNDIIEVGNADESVRKMPIIVSFELI